MKKHTAKLPFLLLAGCAAVLGGCSDDRPEIPSDELYVREFIKNYGVPDAGQTWSMAEGVETSVNVEGVSGGTLEVYTDNPESPTARLAARLPIVGGKVSAKVPLLAGSQKVVMRVLDGDNTIRGDFASVLSAEKKIDAQLKVAALPGSDELPTVEDVDMVAYVQRSGNRYWYQQYLLDPENEGKLPTYQEVNAWFKANGYTYVPNPETPGWVADELQLYDAVESVPKLKYLRNLYFEMGAAVSYKKTLAPIFDQYTYLDPETGDSITADGVFKEGVDNVSRYYHHSVDGNKLDPNVTFSVGTEGPVTMQCIWRGTESSDYFGYYYYKEGEDPTTEELWNDIPKYMFLTYEDIKELSNLTQVKEVDSNYSDDESGWGDMDGMATAECPSWTVRDHDRMIRGRKYYLAFYGENYDEEPSYTFPTGYKIGYFLFKAHGVNDGDFFFSDCKAEYELTGKTYKDNTLDGPYARPFAAKFRMNHRTYVGFADESGDCDLNDVVFIAENVIPDPVDITPPEIKEEHPEAQAWTLACEDLGNTDDIDFNDVVLDISYVKGEPFLTITPRAAGGVLVTDIYFRQGDNTEPQFVGEIHNLLSSKYSAVPTEQQPMLNTKRGDHEVDPRTVNSVIVTVPSDFDFTDPENGFMARIKITTRGYDQKVSEAQEVKAFTDVTSLTVPQMLLLPGGWRWPEERRDISIAYPGFKEWVKDKNATDWVNTGLDGYTVSHRPGCKH